jgi:hypothetical protein
MKYLLDTNIIIFWLKNRYNIPDKIKEVGIKNCYISVEPLLNFDLELNVQTLCTWTKKGNDYQIYFFTFK